jgi:DDE superfamily endonuclease
MLRAVLGCLGAGQTGAAPLEFHYVPKHASWLNMVEIQIGVLAAQCLDRRIDSIEQLTAETTEPLASCPSARLLRRRRTIPSASSSS